MHFDIMALNIERLNFTKVTRSWCLVLLNTHTWLFNVHIIPFQSLLAQHHSSTVSIMLKLNTSCILRICIKSTSQEELHKNITIPHIPGKPK